MKSPNKKVKIKVNVPKDERFGANMMIKDALNFSVIDEGFLAEKLIGIDPRKELSRSYLSTTKHQNDSSFNSNVEFPHEMKNMPSMVSNHYFRPTLRSK